MNALRRTPSDPAWNLIVAAVQGVLIGSLAISAVRTAYAHSDHSIVASLLGDFLVMAMLSAVLVPVFLLFYAAPLLWVCLRLRLAGPATALLGALAPGAAMWAASNSADPILWYFLCIGAAIGLSFVNRAYRGNAVDAARLRPQPE